MQITTIVDVDGVLLDWFGAFDKWVTDTKGWEYKKEGTLSDNYGVSTEAVTAAVNEFNCSARVGFLDAFRDAKYWFPRIHKELGIKFIAVTSFGGDRYSRLLRERNLIDHFGKVFEEIHILDMAACKREKFAEIKAGNKSVLGRETLYLVEDDPKQAQTGLNLGLDTIVMKHQYNLKTRPAGSMGVNNWEDIYDFFNKITPHWEINDGLLSPTKS